MFSIVLRDVGGSDQFWRTLAPLSLEVTSRDSNGYPTAYRANYAFSLEDIECELWGFRFWEIFQGVDFTPVLYGQWIWEFQLTNATYTSIDVGGKLDDIYELIQRQDEEIKQKLDDVTETIVTDISGAIGDSANQITDSIRQGVDDIINEDFGYIKPQTPNVDSGVSDGNNLLDSLNSRIDDFQNNLDSDVEQLNGQLSQASGFFGAIVTAIPSGILIFMVGFVILLVIRKVVGR